MTTPYLYHIYSKSTNNLSVRESALSTDAWDGTRTRTWFYFKESTETRKARNPAMAVSADALDNVADDP